MRRPPSRLRLFQAYDDWFASAYDAWYAELLVEGTGPYRPLRAVIDTIPSLSGRPPAHLDILDCACGTGAAFIPFTRAGYRIWGCDGSQAMLDRARANCSVARVSAARLSRKALDWRNRDGYLQVYKRRQFDVVLLNSNSLCHLPAVEGCIDAALRNFHALIKPGGYLLVDTKRFAEVEPTDGVAMYHEMQFEADAWKERTVRVDSPRYFDGLGEVSVHTRMHYDIDPKHGVCRALVAVTVYGPHAEPYPRLLHYYPLPAAKLGTLLDVAGFQVSWHRAKTEPLRWSYDLAIAQKMR